MRLRVPPSLKHRQFRLLWVGLMISVAGSQMQLWALLWHLRTLSDQPVVVSGIGLARFFPILVVSLFAGVVADMFNRRKIMFVTQISQALVAIGLALLTWSGSIQIWHIYALTAVQAVAISFDQPSRQSLLPNIVPAEDLPNAFSMQSIAFDLGAIIGPGISGLVIGYLGQGYTYLFNAVSYFAVILALILMGPVIQKSDLLPRRFELASIREGVHFILHQPIILSSMVLDFFATFFSAANTLLPFVARDVLKVGALEYGWLSAAQSIGAVTASGIMSQYMHIRRQGRLLLGSVVVFGMATALFGLSRAFWLTMGSLVLIGASDSVSTIIRNTIRQLLTPDALRGRMVSINQIFFSGGPQLGEIESGLAAQAFGIPAAIVIGGVGCIAAAGWIGTRWPQLRVYNGDEPILAGTTAD